MTHGSDEGDDAPVRLPVARGRGFEAASGLMSGACGPGRTIGRKPLARRMKSGLGGERRALARHDAASAPPTKQRAVAMPAGGVGVLGDGTSCASHPDPIIGRVGSPHAASRTDAAGHRSRIHRLRRPLRPSPSRGRVDKDAYPGAERGTPATPGHESCPRRPRRPFKWDSPCARRSSGGFSSRPSQIRSSAGISPRKRLGVVSCGAPWRRRRLA